MSECTQKVVAFRIAGSTTKRHGKKRCAHLRVLNAFQGPIAAETIDMLRSLVIVTHMLHGGNAEDPCASEGQGHGVLSIGI